MHKWHLQPQNSHTMLSSNVEPGLHFFVICVFMYTLYPVTGLGQGSCNDKIHRVNWGFCMVIPLLGMQEPLENWMS